MASEFKFQLEFLSFVKLCALIGFCMGVITIPLGLIQVFSSGGPGFELPVVFLLIAMPFLGLLNSAIFGGLSYPIYWYVTNKIGLKYRGKIHVGE